VTHILGFHVKRIFRFSLVLSLLAGCSALHGQAPELSADAPITFDAGEGVLVATRNAVFRDENTTVEADEIRYRRDAETIEALGNVRVTREGLRLLAEYVTYDARTRAFSARNFRAGYPPLFIEGESFSGDLDKVDFAKVSLYFREPVRTAPKLNIREGSWIIDDSLQARGLRLNAIGGAGLPLPGMTYTFGEPSVDVQATLGYRNSLGLYGQSYWLYPFSKRLSAGGNLDLYSKRGILVGPALSFTDNDGKFRLSLNSGWIHDHASGERGTDLLGARIDQDRGFVDFQLLLRDEGELQFQAKGTYLSDSEVLRDFRDDLYPELFQPDTFVDFTWQHGSLLLNVFTRARSNDYYEMLERLPEVHAEWLPTRLGTTGLVLQATATATRYRLQRSIGMPLSIAFPDDPLGLSWRPYRIPPAPSTLPPAPPPYIIEQIMESIGSPRDPAETAPAPVYNLSASRFFQRLDATTTLTRPFHGPMGTELVLRGGARFTRYEEEGSNRNDERFMGELGFDLSQTLTRTYKVDGSRFGIERLLHQSRISLTYRWHPWDEEALTAPPFDAYRYNAAPPLLDLADLRHVDTLRDWSVARFGWENVLLAAGEGTAYRDFLHLHFYQDLLFSANPGEDEWDAFYTRLSFTPAPWLGFDLTHKVKTESLESEALYLRTHVRSSDLWSASLQVEYLRDAIEHYQVDGRYRLNENFGLLASVAYDTRLDSVTYQRYGITRRFGNVWQLELYLTLTEDDARQDDVSVGARLIWLSF